MDGYVNHFSCEQEILATLSMLNLAETVVASIGTKYHQKFCTLRLCIDNGVCVLSHSDVSDSSQSHELWSTRLLCLWDFPSKNTGVDCHFPIEGSSPCLALAGRLFTTEPPGKSHIDGVGTVKVSFPKTEFPCPVYD